jgi:hypothetical protein
MLGGDAADGVEKVGLSRVLERERGWSKVMHGDGDGNGGWAGRMNFF